ncbi:MAG: GTP-binding protein [Prevotella sp.]|nr:GTP-binding protein [Prevotella sp.]
MNIKETPVLLLTGYLGSGKTTLLNRILANEKGLKFAVIVNDIGEVNIDAGLIQQGGIVGQEDDSLVALQNGCICCTLKMDLVKQVNDIINMQRFDYIVIEASGICEPAPIAQTLSTYPELMPESMMKNGIAKLDSIVTIVDALRMRDEFGLGEDLKKDGIDEEDLASLVIQQIEFCNIIILNKVSEISADELLHLKGVIKEIQPQAKILECDYGKIDLNEILNTHSFDFEEVATSARWIEAMEEESCELENEESGEALEYGIETFVYFRRPAMNLGKFDEFVSTKWPKSVIRAKGMCYFRDEIDTCYLFEQAGRQFNISNAGQWYASMKPEELKEFIESNPSAKKDWDENYGDRMQKLVFIGHDMDRKAIEAALDECLED